MDVYMVLCRHMGSRLCVRMFACLVFCGALFIYRTTLHPGFFPGESARQIAVAVYQAPNLQQAQKTAFSRKDAPFVLDKHRRVRVLQGAALESEVWQKRRITVQTRFRVWSLVSSLVALHVPFGTLPTRMNGLAACFGALSVSILFALVRALLLLLSFHVSLVPSRRRKVAGTAAGLAAAVALGGAVPFWVAATRCLPYTFEIFLLIATGYLLLIAAVRHQERQLLLAGFLLGISLFESESGIWMAPLMLFFAARAIRTGGMGFAHGGVALLSGAAFGVIGYLLLNWLGPHAGETSSLMLPFREIAQSLRIVAATVTGGWLKSAQSVIIACFVVLPALAAIALAIWGDQDMSGVSTSLLLLTLLGTTTLALTGGSISPWGTYRMSPGQQLPCTLFLLIALVVGFLVGQGCLMVGGRFFPDVTRVNRRGMRMDEASESHDSPLGRLLMGYVCVLLLATGIFNLREVLDWREPLSSQMADEAIRRLDGRRWMVTDGALDVLLRLHGHMANSFVGLLSEETPGRMPAQRQSEAILRDAAFAGVDGARLRQRLNGTNPVSFVQALLELAPRVEEQVLVMSNPGLWQQAERQAIPDVVGYRGATGETSVDWDRILRAHVAFWDRVDRLPPLGQYAPVWLRGHRAGLRQQLHEVATRLADELARAGRMEDAKTVLERAVRIKEEPLPSSEEQFY
jgi:hypothetical protein